MGKDHAGLNPTKYEFAKRVSLRAGEQLMLNHAVGKGLAGFVNTLFKGIHSSATGPQIGMNLALFSSLCWV